MLQHILKVSKMLLDPILGGLSNYFTRQGGHYGLDSTETFSGH